MNTALLSNPAAGGSAEPAPIVDAAWIRASARTAGVMYLVMSACMIFAFMYIPARFVDVTDATTTARNITEGVQLYRVGLLFGMLSHILFVMLALKLYQLFRSVDRDLALVMAALVCVGAAAELVNVMNRMIPLVLLSGAEWLSVVPQAQLEAFSLASLRLSSRFGQALTLIWGLWLFPFGLLVIRSGWFPKALGWLLYASGFAYMATATASLAAPEYLGTLSRLLFPLYFAELIVVFWLVIFGARVTLEGRVA